MQTRGAWLVAAAMLSCLPVAPARADDPHRWELFANVQVGVPGGFVKVGEFDRSGDKLGFRHDLGVDHFEVARLGGAYYLTPQDVLRASFDYTFLYGSTTLGEDTAFNGATLAAGTHLQTRPVFTRVTGFYEHTLVDQVDGLRLAGGVGLTWVYLHFKLHGTLAADTVGKETQEDFYAQELPVPLLGVRAEYPLRRDLVATASVDGGLLPRVDSLRTEGGQVTLSQSHADVFLGLRYFWSPALGIAGGYSYTYFTQHETSGEDNNDIVFIGHAFGADVTYRF